MKYELVVSSDEVDFKLKIQELLDAGYEFGPGFSVINSTMGTLFVREMVKRENNDFPDKLFVSEEDALLFDNQDLRETQECARM